MTVVAHPALRYHGAKFRLAPWVQRFFPPHQIYVEPFGGAAGVLLQKPRAYAEVYNDLDGDVCNFFRVLRDPAMRAQLVEACQLTPYARDEFVGAWQPSDDPIERARRTAIRAQMGFGTAGATKSHTGFRISSRRSYTTAQHDWSRYPVSIASAGERFEGVMIEQRPAIDVMLQHDSSETLHYVDPPYVHGSRVMGASKKTYRHEMTDDQHAELLDVVRSLHGMVVLPGYPSEMYTSALQGWSMHKTQARISAGRGTALRTEGATTALAWPPIRHRTTPHYEVTHEQVSKMALVRASRPDSGHGRLPQRPAPRRPEFPVRVPAVLDRNARRRLHAGRCVGNRTELLRGMTMRQYPRITEIPTGDDLAFYCDDECADVQDSLAELIDHHADRETEWFGVGAIVYVADKGYASANQFMMDADDVVEYVYERGADDGPEDTDGWPHVSDEGKAELNALLEAWAEKHLPTPGWWTAENIREYILTQADIDGSKS